MGKKVIRQASSFVADDEHGSPLKLVVMETARVTSLLESDEAELFFLQFLEDWRQHAVRFDLQHVGGVSVQFSDRVDPPGRSRLAA